MRAPLTHPLVHGLTNGLTGALAAVGLALAGCATPPPPQPPAAPPPAPEVSSNVEQPFDQAVAQATDRLIDQARALPAFAAGQTRQRAVLDPMLDAGTGQQTAATQLLERRVRGRFAANFGALEIVPFHRANLARAAYLLTGTLSRALADRPKGTLLLNLALTDLTSGVVIAQAWALTRDDGLDNTPSAHDADNPVWVRDRVVEGYISTSATGSGRRADPVYLERIAISADVNEGATLYDAERYAESLALYRAGLAASGGGEPRALAGEYLASMRLGQGADAERAFGQIVANAIASQQLGVKFLFSPGGTAFWSDPKVSSAYPMWLRQIALGGSAAQACITVVGHTSRTGSEAYNDVLSLQRAAFIRQRLVNEVPALAPRLKTLGMGYRENIVGTGADTADDALDRRVEFRILPCS